MRHDEIKDELRELAFNFFFWFSKFESALKEARYLDPDTVGARARPDWNAFVAEHRLGYQPSAAAIKLLDAKPRRQVVGEYDLDFEEVPFPSNTPDLDRVVALAKTVRNNLFHGGKHGSAFWDDPDRMRLLLETTIAVLDELARKGGFEDHYTGYY